MGQAFPAGAQQWLPSALQCPALARPAAVSLLPYPELDRVARQLSL